MDETMTGTEEEATICASEDLVKQDIASHLSEDSMSPGLSPTKDKGRSSSQDISYSVPIGS